MKLIHGDSLVELKKLQENSVDAVITDPPYELGFMGKKWDNTGIAYNIELWQECLRVLKPGGHLLAFGGTRTYHRMACAIEDAGFEVRDMLEWIYASGFPKSQNIGKMYNKIETEEWSKIGKALDLLNKKDILNIWKNNLKNVRFVGTQSKKSQIETGMSIEKKDTAQSLVAQNDNQENSDLLVSFVDENLKEVQVTNIKTNTVLQNVEAEIKQRQDLVKCVEKLLQSQSLKSLNTSSAEWNVNELLKENENQTIKVEEALMTLRGKKKYGENETINALCVALTEILKHTILNQSKTFQSLDTIQKMECVSAINVTITEYTAELLISNTVDIAKKIAVDKLQGNEREAVGDKPYSSPDFSDEQFIEQGSMMKTHQKAPRIIIKETKGNSEWEGFGTALKPAHEPIIMARKPLSEKTIVENVLLHGTGAIDIDSCRIPTSQEDMGDGDRFKGHQNSNTIRKNMVDNPTEDFKERVDNGVNTQGRFPANIICTDDALNDGVMTKSGHLKAGHKRGDGTGNSFMGGGGTVIGNYGNDEGSKSRYFDIDVWGEKHGLLQFPKASKSERNKGCEKIEAKNASHDGRDKYIENPYQRHDNIQSNNHPTVKPIHLMSWLVRLVSKEGDVVLDPFNGSGTTGVACKKLGRDYIGIDMTEEYIEIAKARINNIA